MKKILLGIIAINLTFISINLALRSIEPAKIAICDPDGRKCSEVREIDGVPALITFPLN